MKSLSIRSFTLIGLFLLFVMELALSINLFYNSKHNIEEVIRENIQTKVLTLRHFLQRNMQIDNANSVTAYLDNAVMTNTLFNDIHIADAKHRVLYATDRTSEEMHKEIVCKDIGDIASVDVFSQKCYRFSLRLFKGLKPHYYTVYIYINSKYLDSILNEQIRQYMRYFFIFVILFTLFAWWILRKFIAEPLESLRQYAYYSKKPPKPFLISEIESIRYSLVMTFKRLKKEQEELYKLSTQDSLSGLYNRLSLLEKLKWLISKYSREKKKFAVVFIDLDDFKNINDTRGHEFGDLVLKEVAHILLDSVRQNDIVSRFGGDEFVIVINEIEDETLVISILERIRKKLSEPIKVDAQTHILITASMGIAIFPKDGEDVSTLLKHADIAMYKSKEKGKNSYHFFTESLNELIQERVNIEKLMHEGLKKGYFKLFYQPKVDIHTNAIMGCEALIRLIDPKQGIISPDRFIPIAESNGFIIQLGEWVIQEACMQIQHWSKTKLRDVKISINVSGVQFKDKNLLSIIQKHTKKIDTSKLDIELTESVLMEDFEHKVATIKEIKKLGITFSLDDFGTGYSSLSYMKNIPFDTIKIDKMFIDDLLEDEKEATFVNLIVAIAKNLHLEIVAEGVETLQQLEYLKKIECDIYQGYYCSKPLPAEEFEKLFSSHECTL